MRRGTRRRAAIRVAAEEGGSENPPRTGNQQERLGRIARESSETERQTAVLNGGCYSPICMATCRARQKCPRPGARKRFRVTAMNGPKVNRRVADAHNTLALAKPNHMREIPQKPTGTRR